MALLPDELRDGALALRRLRVEMIDDMVAAIEASFMELNRWMTWAARVPTREALIEYVRASQEHFDHNVDWEFAIFEKEFGDFVGQCGLHGYRREPTCLEIGYWVRSDRTGRGYAAGAASILTDAAFTFLDVDEARIRMDRGNVASAAIPPKIGYRLLREERRAIETPGHTGRGLIWSREREL